MTKVFNGVNPSARLELAAIDGKTVFTAVSRDGYAITVSLHNASGTEIALAVLEAMDAPEHSQESVAAACLRNALAERQRDQKLEALAQELVNAYPTVVWEEMTTMGKTWWLQVAAKALELGASVDN